jgi:hypothetical protein
VSYSWLPTVLAEIADIAGLDAALALAESRGGLKVYIPVSVGDDHWLTQAVGRDAADRICEHFAFVASEGTGRHGVHVEIPLGPRGSVAKHRSIVDRMIAEGRPMSAIALAAGYTERGVRYRKARARSADPRQTRLPV